MKIPKNRRKAASELLWGPEVRDGILHLSAKDLSAYSIGQLKVMLATRDYEIVRLRALVAKLEAERNAKALQESLAGLAALVKAENADFKQLQDDLERVYEVDVKDLTYDDETGRLSTIKGGPILVGDEGVLNG